MRIAYLFLLLTFAACSKENKTNEETVIDKDKVTWVPDISEALAKAKATGKLVFVECYSPTCPICQSIEPYFSTPEVAERYNADFVNYKLDVGVAEQVKFLNDHNIWLPSFPQFLFFDGDGNLVHQAEVTASTESILAAAEEAKSEDKRAGNYKARFEKGERDFDFLVKYGVYTRLVKDTLANLEVGEALFEGFDKSDLGSQTSWAVTKKVVTSVDNGFFKYWINQIPKAASFEKAAGHAGQELNSLGGIVQASIFRDAKKYSTQKISEVKDYIRKVGGGEFADTYVWEQETLANLREGKPAAAINIGKSMAAKFSNNGPSLVYIVRVFNDNFPDNSYLPVAREWLHSAANLVTEPAQKAEYHYELARVLQKSGDKAAAVAQAAEAEKHAEAAKIDSKKFKNLSNSLR
jgi:thioredoxin-related protein